jgi:hypothetical protein
MDESERLKLQAWLAEARSTYNFIHNTPELELVKVLEITETIILEAA